MTAFNLKIVTPDGLKFDGDCEELVVRTTGGDMGILAHHLNCVAPLGMGRATVVIGGEKRYAACIGGMVSVVNGQVRLVPTTFEWAEEIDKNRAENAADRARKAMDTKAVSGDEVVLAEARLKRALVRINVADTLSNR